MALVLRLIRGAALSASVALLFAHPAWSAGPPQFISIAPNSGPSAGGTSVTVTFQLGTTALGLFQGVTVGGAPLGNASALACDNVYLCTVTGTTAAHAAGPADVAISTFATTTAAGAFTYVGSGKMSDSDAARAAQVAGSYKAGQISGAAITSAVDGAIGETLYAPSAAPPASINQPAGLGAGTAQMSRLGALSSSAYGQQPSLQRGWKAWGSVATSGWDQDGNLESSGSQINATFGVGRLVMPGLAVGVFGGYETFDHRFGGIGSKLEGDGLTAGAYMGLALTRHLRWDVLGAYTRLSYDASAGAASGSFDGNRVLLSTGLVGNHRMGALVVEPSARVYWLRESQEAWVDSLGAAQAARDFTAGRASAGGKIVYPWQSSPGTSIAPFAGLFADYRFSSDDALPVSPDQLGLSDGWSLRAQAGLLMTFEGGMRASVEGELGGIGRDDSVWSLMARGSLPF